MNRQIRFSYTKIINASCSNAWDRLVYEDSYTEFKMQAQRFNEEGKYKTFSDLLQHNPSATQLHFLVSGAVLPYIKCLEEKIPGVLNVLGKQCLPFTDFSFEIIHSDVSNASKHNVAINFFSKPVYWLDTVGDKMIISLNEPINGEWLTETISLQPFLSIYSVKQ